MVTINATFEIREIGVTLALLLIIYLSWKFWFDR